MRDGMDLLRHPRAGAWGVAEDSTDYEKKSLLATVEILRAELLARDALVESLQQEVNMLHSIKRTSPVAVAPRQKRAAARGLQLDDLPDGLLLRVFTYMDKLFLANVMSVVCKRWRGLARDPSLWCDVQLTYSNPEGLPYRARLFARALEAAPAVDTLEWGFSEADPPALRYAVENCNTGAKHLCVNLDSAAPDAVLRLLWTSRRVLTVFCLREGPLSASYFSPSQASRFWELIGDAPQLQSLVLFLSQRSGLASCMHAFRALPATRSSLRTLFVDVGVLDVDDSHGELGVTLQLLIRAHQHTLVDVHLPMRVGTPGALLAASRCPALRVVSTPASADVKTLKSASSLRELRLTVGKPLLSHYYLLQDVGQLQHLTKLRLVQLPPRTADDLGLAAGLLAVLTPQSALRELAMTCLPPSAALDRLCVLPLAAPHLEELKVRQSCGDAADGGCRLPAVRRLVLCRPGLHVVLESVAVSDRCCDYHRDLEALRPEVPLTYVGHPRDGCCVERLKSVGTVLLLAPEGARHTQWCEVAADGTDIPCRPLTGDAYPASLEETTPLEEITPLPEDAPLSPDVPPSPSSTTTGLKAFLGPIKVSIPLYKVNFSGCAEITVNDTSKENVLMVADSNQDVTGAANSCGEAPVDASMEDSIQTPTRTSILAAKEDPGPIDKLVDAPVDAPRDTPTGTPTDTPTDTSVDTSVHTPVDTSVDTAVDTSVDTPVDTSVDTPVDTSADTPFDAPVEAFVQTPFSAPFAIWNEAPVEGPLELPAESTVEASFESPSQIPNYAAVGFWNEVPFERSVEASPEVSAETSMQEAEDKTNALQPSRRNSTRSCRRASYRDCYDYCSAHYAFTRKMKVGKLSTTSRRPKAAKAGTPSSSGSPCLPSSTESLGSCPVTPESVATAVNLNHATPEPVAPAVNLNQASPEAREPVVPAFNLNHATPEPVAPAVNLNHVTPEPLTSALNFNPATFEPLDDGDELRGFVAQQPVALSPSSTRSTPTYAFLGFNNESPSPSPPDQEGSTSSEALQAVQAVPSPSSTLTVLSSAFASVLVTVLPDIPSFEGVPSGASRARWQSDAEGHAGTTDRAGCALCPHSAEWCPHRDELRRRPSTGASTGASSGPSQDDDMECES